MVLWLMILDTEIFRRSILRDRSNSVHTKNMRQNIIFVCNFDVLSQRQPCYTKKKSVKLPKKAFLEIFCMRAYPLNFC